MSTAVVLGAGVAGHTAAMYLRKWLPREHEVIVVSPNRQYNWIPSNIWVGVGKTEKEDVVFDLAPVYAKHGISYRQAKAVGIYPDGVGNNNSGVVEVQNTAPESSGRVEQIPFDYLINATGPQLNFAATPGLGPDAGHTVSVCTADHAVHAASELKRHIDALRRGAERRTMVVGMGHGTCTCEGAAFEYIFNVDHELREAGVRHLVDLVYLTNEAELGDFGVGGLQFAQQGFTTNSELWTGSLFAEREVKVILGAHVLEVTPDVILYETLDGEHHAMNYDFGMLLPPFTGVDMWARDPQGNDVTSQYFAPNKFMMVDAVYGKTNPEDWQPEDWPTTYQVPSHPNIFAVGIAFAPPHAISTPRTSPRGTLIAPAPPRTGMPSGVQGKTAARTVADRILRGPTAPAHKASMATTGAACVASAGTGIFTGSAAAMTMMPIVPDYSRYPTGRDVKQTTGEIGLSGHWVKVMLHHLFLHKAKARPGWSLIPE